MAYFESLPPAQRAAARLEGLLRAGPDGRALLDQTAFDGPVLRQGEKEDYTAEERGRFMLSDWMRWPVIQMTFPEAQQYAAWLAASGRVPGARLCNDLEWEKAARGADGRPYPHAQRLLPDEATFGETYGIERAYGRWLDEVAMFPASRSVYGVDDMAGGVFEWTESARAPGTPVLRSGGWRNAADSMRSEWAQLLPATSRFEEVGLRICVSVAQVGP